jgi:hypothetical protein
VIGPWLFTRRLLPLLKSTAQQPGSDVRVVTLGSGAHKFPSAADADYTSKEKWNRTFDKTLVKSMSRYGALHSIGEDWEHTDLFRRLGSLFEIGHTYMVKSTARDLERGVREG